MKEKMAMKINGVMACGSASCQLAAALKSSMALMAWHGSWHVAWHLWRSMAIMKYQWRGVIINRENNNQAISSNQWQRHRASYGAYRWQTRASSISAKAKMKNSAPRRASLANSLANAKRRGTVREGSVAASASYQAKNNGVAWRSARQRRRNGSKRHRGGEKCWRVAALASLAAGGGGSGAGSASGAASRRERRKVRKRGGRGTPAHCTACLSALSAAWLMVASIQSGKLAASKIKRENRPLGK
jgi:hypothetical protein